MEHMKRKTEIDKLEREEHLEREEWIGLLTGWDEEDRAYAGERAREISHRYFGNRIYVRGLIEFTSYCRNDCYYCGLRRSNTKACRYRLPEAEILSGMVIRGETDIEAAAKYISDTYGCAVLLKGGHNVNDANDFLYADGNGEWFYGTRIDNPNTHGTGCTLSSAIAANLAKGFDLPTSIQRSKD